MFPVLRSLCCWACYHCWEIAGGEDVSVAPRLRASGVGVGRNGPWKNCPCFLLVWILVFWRLSRRMNGINRRCMRFFLSWVIEVYLTNSLRTSMLPKLFYSALCRMRRYVSSPEALLGAVTNSVDKSCVCYFIHWSQARISKNIYFIRWKIVIFVDI